MRAYFFKPLTGTGAERNHQKPRHVVWDVKQFASAVLGFVLLASMNASPSFGQIPQNEPTRQEIAEAYRNKAVIVGWEKWRIYDLVHGPVAPFHRLIPRRASFL